MSRRVWTILALSFAVFLLAYALREPIEQKVIRPLARQRLRPHMKSRWMGSRCRRRWRGHLCFNRFEK